MYVSLEGLPALGKSELLALLHLYYPEQVLILPELVKQVAEREKLDLFRDRKLLAQAILDALPERQMLIRRGLSDGRVVVEESHLGVHAAYSAALDDSGFIAAFQRLEEWILWPEVFLRLEAPVEVSILRQAARADPRYMVPKEILARMAGWLAAWHARRGDRVEVIDADQPPEEVVAAVSRALSLHYMPYAVPGVFPYLFLLGRPASGKSELIQFLTSLPLSERACAYHVGALRVLDDFPLLWEKFVEDDLWEEMGRGRLHSKRCNENYVVVDDHLWDFLTLCLNHKLSRAPAQPGETVLVELSRGGSHAYRRTLAILDSQVLRKGAILYLSISYEESLRRNQARYDRDHRDGVLTHSVPEEEMASTYRFDDWSELGLAEAGYIEIRDVRVPYVTVHNEPEPKSFADFSYRFEPALNELFDLWKNR